MIVGLAFCDLTIYSFSKEIPRYNKNKFRSRTIRFSHRGASSWIEAFKVLKPRFSPLLSAKIDAQSAQRRHSYLYFANRWWADAMVFRNIQGWRGQHTTHAACSRREGKGREGKGREGKMSSWVPILWHVSTKPAVYLSPPGKGSWSLAGITAVS